MCQVLFHTPFIYLLNYYNEPMSQALLLFELYGLG